jgi:hypothetical protein
MAMKKPGPDNVMSLGNTSHGTRVVKKNPLSERHSELVRRKRLQQPLPVASNISKFKNVQVFDNFEPCTPPQVVGHVVLP